MLDCDWSSPACCNQLVLAFSDTRRRTFTPRGGGGGRRLSLVTCTRSNNGVHSSPAVTQDQLFLDREAAQRAIKHTETASRNQIQL